MSLLSGVAAKEIVVSTLGVLYAEGPAEAQLATAAEESQDAQSPRPAVAPADDAAAMKPVAAGGAVSEAVTAETSAATVGEVSASAQTVAPDDDAEAEEFATLSARLRASGDFDTASALAFLVFILVYFPCIATVAAIGSEAGWKWALLSVFYNTALAWVVSWVTYHLATWL